MREILKKEALQPAASLRFLYYNRFGGLCLKLLTRRFISKIAGWFLDSALSRPMIQRYIKKHGIDMNLYLPEKYKSFNAFFTRRIRPELRPFAEGEREFPSPCDGKVSLYPITEGREFTVKGFTYTVETLLKNEELAKEYAGGNCLVLRLCVEDYHRYFYVDSGSKEENVFIKGKLHTVQPTALERRRVFTENCREYTVMHTEHFGDIVQVEVGAMMVGRIVNNEGATQIARGGEKGRFEFGGSTIIVLLKKNAVTFDEEFFVNTERGDETIVKCGERLGFAGENMTVVK